MKTEHVTKHFTGRGLKLILRKNVTAKVFEIRKLLCAECARSLKAMDKEFETNRYNFLAVQEVIWDKRGTDRAKENNYFCIKVGYMSLIKDRIWNIRE